MLPEEENRALLRASVAFEKDMEPIRLIAHMIADGIFNDGDVERVRSKTTRGERVLEFVMIYKRKAQSLTALKDALLYDGLKHLVDVLDNSTHTDAHDAVGQANAGQLRSLLTLGGVPGTLPKHVERTVQLRSLGDTLLRSAAKGSFWVVLHGMAGCGKTTLSSDVLRSDARLIGDAFQRVIWVRCDDPPAEFQSQKLFKLLYNLHTKLGTGANADVKFDDVETALHFVRQAILDSYPNLLIVLDDVWSADIAQHLDDIEHKTPYRYSTFYKAAKISCDDLTPQQLKNFCAFAIFPVNVLVPDAVLAAIWPGDIPWKGKLIKVQDDMIELRDRSLIEETVATEIDRGRRRRFYSLHFLLHAYLKRFPSASQRDTQTLCRDLVEKLQAALHNQTRDFPDYDILEEFFYVNLGYFLYKANLRDHFPLFFLNLVELIRRLKWSTPSTILVEFHIYNRWIAHWDPSKMDAFLKFFRRNASHLRRVRNEIDAVQLSLVEASTSPVYEQAKKMAVKLLESDSTGNILLLEPCDRDTEADKRDALTLDGYVVGGSLFAALFLDQNGGLFVACSRQNRRLLICDARSGQTVKRIKLSGIVEKVSVSDSKSLVVSFRNDPRVLLYDVSAEPIVDDVMLLPDANAVTPSPVLLYL
uniref:NB-ARC domain-containing protein n=1 Tax=Plectus sambesii TaxID=2011161 RepID=A0A914XM96_9BILA